MIEEYGYNEDSAEEILAYASNNLWRDSWIDDYVI
jgi:hypothetical protein